FDRIHLGHIVSFAAVNSLFTLVLGLWQGALAKNKVEGFALIRGSGMLALLPALMVLGAFQGKLQYVLGVFPNCWAIRGMLVQLMPVGAEADLSYALYLLIGTAYNLLLLAAAYKMFLRRAQY